MSYDLNVNNYNYDDLLNLFKINNIVDTIEIRKADLMCKNIKDKKYPENIYSFYNNCRKILNIIKIMYNKGMLENLQDTVNIDHYVAKIKNIEDFGILENLDIVDMISPSKKKMYNNEIKTNEVASTYPSNTAPGDLNSIKRTTRLLNLNLNSCYRTNYYLKSSSDFTYIFPSILNNVTSLRLASIELPICWYLFSHKQKNNIFNIKIKQDETVYDFAIIIPDGNYSFDSLESFLNDTYFYLSGTESFLKNIKFTIDKVSLHSRFEIIDTDSSTEDLNLESGLNLNGEFDILFCKKAPAPQLYFSLCFLEDDTQNIQNTAGWILGFRLPTYFEIYGNIQSEGLYDGSGDKYIYMSLNDFQYNYSYTNIVYFGSSVLMDDILAKIPIVNGKLSLSVYDNNNPLNKIRLYNGPINLNRIAVKLYDKFGNIIDLNNMDYSFTLELEMLYENFNFKNVNS